MSTTLRPLTAELREQAEQELGEVPTRLAEDLEHIKVWLRKQTYIRARYDDQFLIAFLRGCKFSLERVKEKLDMYYTVRTAVPEFFDNRDPFDLKIKSILQQGITIPIPNVQLPDGSRIFLIRIGAFDPNIINAGEIMKICYMITDVLLWDDDNTTICGHTIVCDLRGLSFGHVTQFPAGLIKKMTTSIQEAYPIRQKGIHFVNPPMAFDALFKIFSSFMSDKLKKRLYVHDSFEALHKEIPTNLLPKEYGGEADTVQNIADYWTKIVTDKREWFLEESQYKTDEKKRPGRPKNADNIFGVDGSFRSLAVD